MAERELGEMYMQGRGTDVDYVRAVAWYQKASNGGDAIAEMHLAAAYRSGTGVTKDLEQAHALSIRAANQGWPTAESDLGYDYLQGRGTPVDYAQALDWLNKAAERRDVSAYMSLGYMYCNGLGVAKDTDICVNWYKAAAELGNRQSQLFLAGVYRDGSFGMSKDATAAEKYYVRASEGMVQSTSELAEAMKEIIDAHKSYPKDAVTAKQVGLVVVEFDCPDRKPENVTVTQSSGFPLLDAAARQAVLDSYFPDRILQLKGIKHFKIAINFLLGAPSVPEASGNPMYAVKFNSLGQISHALYEGRVGGESRERPTGM